MSHYGTEEWNILLLYSSQIISNSVPKNKNNRQRNRSIEETSCTRVGWPGWLCAVWKATTSPESYILHHPLPRLFIYQRPLFDFPSKVNSSPLSSAPFHAAHLRQCVCVRPGSPLVNSECVRVLVGTSATRVESQTNTIFIWHYSSVIRREHISRSILRVLLLLLTNKANNHPSDFPQ